MLASLLNNFLRRRSAKNNPLACLVCPHVLEDQTLTTFMCRTMRGYAASCAETCREFEAGEKLGTIHLGHILSTDQNLLSIGGLPINIALRRDGDTWLPSYFFDEYKPTEGDFVAPEKGDHLLDIKDDDEWFVFSLGNETLVTANLDDGFQIIPIWETVDQTSEFQAHLLGSEKLKKVPYGQIKKWAQENGVRFLGPNFLNDSVDHALIV